MSPPRYTLAARRDARGFTLIELIMVLVLLGILAVFALPRIDLTRGFDEVGYRDAVRATLEYARKSAVAERRNVRVTLGVHPVLLVSTLTLTIENTGPENSTGTFPRALNLPTPDRRCEGPTNQLCSPGVALSGPTTLTFNPLGQPSAAATYTVTGVGPVTVEAETGHVH